MTECGPHQSSGKLQELEGALIEGMMQALGGRRETGDGRGCKPSVTYFKILPKGPSSRNRLLDIDKNLLTACFLLSSELL